MGPRGISGFRRSLSSVPYLLRNNPPSRYIHPLPVVEASFFQHYEKNDTRRVYGDAKINFTQTSSYKSLVLQHIMSAFELNSNRSDATTKVRLIDLGGGMGTTSELLSKSLSKCGHEGSQVVCVDPFEAMLSEAKRCEGIDTLLMDAVHFSSLPNQSYSHALLKEMIHLIPALSTDVFFRGLHRQLLPGGKMLIVTRPVEVFLPFPERVKEIWRTTQPPHEVIQTNIRKTTGMEPHVWFVDCRVSIPKSQWIHFLRSKTWSEFSMLSESEMEEGIQEVTRKYFNQGGGDHISFVDRLVFICATKST